MSIGAFIVYNCGCSYPPDQGGSPSDHTISDDFILLPEKYDHDIFWGNYHSSLWNGNRIYSSGTLRFYDLDDSMKVIHDSIPLYLNSNTQWDVGIEGLIGMRFNNDRMKIIGVQSQYPDVALGKLVEVDIATLKISVLVDSTMQVSSAAYLDDDSIIFYSYGSYSDLDTQPSDAGYYLFIKSTGAKKFLLHHISSLGPSEILNGFDVHPDHSRILIPSTGNNRAPIVFEFNIMTSKKDTLFTAFDTPSVRWCLSLRYNSDGSKILYSAYPIKVLDGGATLYDYSETGIIDRKPLSIKILQTNPYLSLHTNVICLFPSWSPDEKSIIYGSAPISSEGRIASHYTATILKAFQ
ncbi:MAG TPA: hypothetical protein VFO76_06705 [Candidatus Kapabacteria bacterium]|nr:hypothetical protein [Candidatus Kapabacteria bacterium]